MSKAEGQRQSASFGWLSSWVLARGESIVFAAGIALTVLVLGVCGGTAWWTHKQLRASTLSQTAARSEMIAQTEAATLEALLTKNDLTQARRILSETAQREGFSYSRLALAGGEVVADLKPERVTAEKLPEEWGRKRSANSQPSVTTQGDEVIVRVPINVEERGWATLEIHKTNKYEWRDSLRALSGVGIIAVFAMVGVLGIYTLLRRKLRGLGAVRDSLLAVGSFEDKELPRSGFRVSDSLGKEAVYWNKLLDERDALVSALAVEKAAERSRSDGGGGGEFASAFDALWMGLVILDSTGVIRSLNGAAAAVLKKPKPEIVGRPFASVVPDPQLSEMIMAVASGKTRQRASVEVVLDGDRPGADKTVLRYTVRPLRRDDSVSAILVIEDVTQQRIADESRNSFVAQATHELRTPLTNMRLYLDQLVEEGDSDPVVKARSINVLSSETRRLERIVGDMLSVAEIEAGSFNLHTDDVRVETMLEELRQDFLAQAKEKEIILAFDLPPKLPVISGDRDKIMLAVSNLIGNALKYTAANGQVTVKVEESAGALYIHVADTGIGVKDEEQELIFEKFYRSKDRRIASVAGSGIGLSLARQIVRLHGGEISVKSTLDKGSTFSLRLPARTPIAQRQAA
jgi:signal transduction histidine kinase